MRHASCTEIIGYCTGQQDFPLDDMGRATVAKLCSRWSGGLPGQIFCSDLARARETAAGLVGPNDARPIIDRRLREICLGTWQGQSWDQLYQQQPEQLEHWGRHWLDCAPPGGESGRQLFHRVKRWWQDHRGLLDSSSLVVAHAGSLRALACLLQNRPPESMFDYQFSHCAPQQVPPWIRVSNN